MPTDVKYIFTGAEGASFCNVDNVSLPEGMKLIMPQQTHTSNVGIVTSPDQYFTDTDALITQLPGVAIGVRTADCVPLLLYAPDIRAVAAIHAGWKGSVGNIVANTLDKLVMMGADLSVTEAVFGPSICGDCYETGSDLAEKFVDAGLIDAVTRGDGEDPLGEKSFGTNSVRIDLQKANAIIMLRTGIQAANITFSSECTRHSSRNWPSWRRNPGTTERLATVIYLSPTNLRNFAP